MNSKKVPLHQTLTLDQALALFSFFAEDGSKHVAVYSRQPRLLPIPEPGGASLHHAPYRHHPVCFWQ